MSYPEVTFNPTVVHVAGPVEPEAVGRTHRYRRQRCLRCDVLLWDERAAVRPFLLGDSVVGVETHGAGWTWVATNRAQLAEDERACHP